MSVLFILQNAYTNDKHPFTNNEEWHRELNRSHSGRRLKEMMPDNIKHYVINSSPLIGYHPDSSFNADLKYITRKIKEIKPVVICACGKTAQGACEKLGIDFISAPHPAWRALSKKVTSSIQKEIRKALEDMETT